MTLRLEPTDPWTAWRKARLEGSPQPVPAIPGQDAEGGFLGDSGRPSPGATGEALCHLVILGLEESGAAAVAADWLEEARTPALAWLDAPYDAPGTVETAAVGRVWATAAAACGLLSVGRDPGPRALELLRGEANMDGSFTGGAYPTFAAAGAYWRAHGAKNEMAEWALKWAREGSDEFDTWERVTGLVFWGAAGIPADHATVEQFLDELRDPVAGHSSSGPDEVSLRAAEVLAFYGA